MLIQELYCALARGVLSNLAMANRMDGTIDQEWQPSVILYANEALQRLYTRFVLKQKEFILEQREELTFYHLLKGYSQSGHDPLLIEKPYIMDLGREPFQEDLIKILQVYGSDGKEIPLNDSNRIESIYTPQAKLVQIPFPRPGISISVVYQARHPALVCDTQNPVNIELPEDLEEAFLSYIGYKMHSTIATAESVAKGAELNALWNELCAEAEARDSSNTSWTPTNYRFEKFGWK